MNQILENWRKSLKKIETEERNYRYFEQAIEKADAYDDFAWTMNDFIIEDLGLINLDELESQIPFGPWVRDELTRVDHLKPEERIYQLPELDSAEKKQAALLYIKRPEIRPPVVVVTAPDSNNDSLYSRYGYGHGLINLNIALGIKDIHVVHLKYKHEVESDRKHRGLAGPPGRLANYQDR